MAKRSRRVLVVMHRWVGYLHGIQLGMAQYFMQRPEWVWTQIQPRPEHFSSIGQMEVDGAIAYVEHAYLSELHRLKVPVVNVSNWIEEKPFPLVLPDDAAIGRMAARYLRDLGLRNFGVVKIEGATYAEVRGKAFTESLKEEGITVHSPYEEKFTIPTVSKVPLGVNLDLLSWLRSVPKPIGIFGTNDDVAAEVADVCRHAGIRVPEDVCVLGVDNDELVTRVSNPPLSSIALPLQKIGYEAAALLERLMGGEAAPEKPILLAPVGVVTRQSTDLLAIEDDDVRTAVRYIREHVHERVTVKDLLRVVPVNRRYLERNFKVHTGRTPLQEIRRARLEKAKELLTQTDMPMPVVAKRSGFPNAERLANVFRSLMKMTPTEYRKKAEVGG